MHARTLLQLIDEGLERVGPAKLAVASSDASLCYGELLGGARGIAATLADAGIGRGSRVGISMEKSPASVQSLLGVMMAGAAYVPIDPRSPWQRCRTIALDCSLSGLVVDEGRLAVLPAFLDGQSPRLVLAEGEGAQVAAAAGSHPHAPLAIARASPPRDLARPGPDDLAYILYTSGSTGTPKGVVHGAGVDRHPRGHASHVHGKGGPQHAARRLGEENDMSEKAGRGSVAVEQELHRFISSEVLRQRTNVALEAPLVQSGLVDSLGLLQIIAHVEKAYGVRLTESGNPRDFRSISSLAAAVCRLGGRDLAA